MFPLRQIILIATPPVLLATTCLAYRGLARLFGPRLGYLAGFLFYWIVWCLLLSWWALGANGLARVFRDVYPRFGSTMWLGPLLLVIPLLLGYGYVFPRAIKGAHWNVILLSALVALVNGTMEGCCGADLKSQFFRTIGCWDTYIRRLALQYGISLRSQSSPALRPGQPGSGGSCWAAGSDVELGGAADRIDLVEDGIPRAF